MWRCVTLSLLFIAFQCGCTQRSIYYIGATNHWPGMHTITVLWPLLYADPCSRAPYSKRCYFFKTKINFPILARPLLCKHDIFSCSRLNMPVSFQFLCNQVQCMKFRGILSLSFAFVVIQWHVVWTRHQCWPLIIELLWHKGAGPTLLIDLWLGSVEDQRGYRHVT